LPAGLEGFRETDGAANRCAHADEVSIVAAEVAR
jgi:hypothetical protein